MSICLLFDEVRTSTPEYFSVLSGWQWEWLRGKILRAGLSPEALSVSLSGSANPSSPIILGFGESPLFSLTGKRSVDKWCLSPLPLPTGQTYIPIYDLTRMNKQYELGLYLDMALARAKEYSAGVLPRGEERFHLNPPLEETYALLDFIKGQPEIAVDVETGYGQINTVGFAWSESDAIAINVLPGRGSVDTEFELWRRIQAVLESPSRKIFQNFIYDVSYFSAYGIRTENIHFDTMWAMKILYPELKSNLGNVGRIYTRRPYWKDDGKVTDEEGAKKDWGNIRDWTKHYLYNCRDTTGTLDASRSQRRDLEHRGLRTFYVEYVEKLTQPILEMCGNGVPLDLGRREELIREVEGRLEVLTREFQEKAGSELNPRSPKQVIGWLKHNKIELPKKYDKKSGTYKETSDSAAIKKIRLKKDLPGLRELQEIKSLDKSLSSYLNFDVRPDGRLSYSLNGCGTETLRWSGGKDPWDRGFNIQTIPREGGDVSIKSMFLAPEGYSFLEVDLRQAESRFVAYDSADKTLIDMLESGADVHSHVGNAILRQMGKDPQSVSKDEFKQTWRQLGKKAGHGLNYGMKAGVFVETVFNELDMVISRKDAETIRQAYFSLFPGIPRWHAWVKNELYTKRKLSAPSGWERYFYGRPDDALKEGLAWRPQHTIPWITNHLMLSLMDRRKHGELEFRLVTQVHDALYLLVRDEWVERVARYCLDHMAWHPQVDLPGGRMYIPTEVLAGRRMNEKKELHL